MMSRSNAARPQASVVLQRLDNAALVVSDKNKVQWYIKDILFEKVIFILDQDSLKKGEVLHQDYLDNCKGLIADGQLEKLSDEEAEMYMNLFWNIMTKDGCYNKWMQSKQSNTYQAMRDKFMSKCHSFIVFLLDCATDVMTLTLLTSLRDMQRCVMSA